MVIKYKPSHEKTSFMQIYAKPGTDQLHGNHAAYQTFVFTT